MTQPLDTYLRRVALSADRFLVVCRVTISKRRVFIEQEPFACLFVCLTGGVVAFFCIVEGQLDRYKSCSMDD